MCNVYDWNRVNYLMTWDWNLGAVVSYMICVEPKPSSILGHMVGTIEVQVTLEHGVHCLGCMVRLGLSFLLLPLVVNSFRMLLSPAFITVGYKVVITWNTGQPVSVPLVKLTHVLVITAHLPHLLGLAVVDSAGRLVRGAGLVVRVRVGDGYAQLLVILPDRGVKLPLARLRVLEPSLVLVGPALVILVWVVPAVSEKESVTLTEGIMCFSCQEKCNGKTKKSLPTCKIGILKTILSNQYLFYSPERLMIEKSTFKSLCRYSNSMTSLMKSIIAFPNVVMEKETMFDIAIVNGIKDKLSKLAAMLGSYSVHL